MPSSWYLPNKPAHVIHTYKANSQTVNTIIIMNWTTDTKKTKYDIYAYSELTTHIFDHKKLVIKEWSLSLNAYNVQKYAWHSLWLVDTLNLKHIPQVTCKCLHHFYRIKSRMKPFIANLTKSDMCFSIHNVSFCKSRKLEWEVLAHRELQMGMANSIIIMKPIR